jgi:hypothetical protein
VCLVDVVDVVVQEEDPLPPLPYSLTYKTDDPRALDAASASPDARPSRSHTERCKAPLISAGCNIDVRASELPAAAAPPAHVATADDAVGPVATEKSSTRPPRRPRGATRPVVRKQRSDVSAHGDCSVGRVSRREASFKDGTHDGTAAERQAAMGSLLLRKSLLCCGSSVITTSTWTDNFLSRQELRWV